VRASAHVVQVEVRADAVRVGVGGPAGSVESSRSMSTARKRPPGLRTRLISALRRGARHAEVVEDEHREDDVDTLASGRSSSWRRRLEAYVELRARAFERPARSSPAKGRSRARTPLGPTPFRGEREAAGTATDVEHGLVDEARKIEDLAGTPARA
jgi:hypothetical protein